MKLSAQSNISAILEVCHQNFGFSDVKTMRKMCNVYEDTRFSQNNVYNRDKLLKKGAILFKMKTDQASLPW